MSTLGRIASSPRFWTYVGCTCLAVLASCLLGKDMNWDTLDYHFYAGFSALHDRFGTDYFPAGSQSYFNPYIYLPFYLLASSRLPALVDASILAVLQSCILWLTYEITLQVAPAQDARGRIAIAICSTLFAFANPILLNLFGSSYADVTTAELVLCGWLLLVRAVRTPGVGCVLSAGLLLGAASALKLTNSVHALSAGVLFLFIPQRWPGRIRYTMVFGAALAVSFVLICLPWSTHLERQFGNPLFPLLNGIFQSPQFPTARMLDYRFIPESFVAGLLRPFTIAKPLFKVDDEMQSPDVRYAVLLVGLILMLLRWAWRRYRHGRFGHAFESQPDTDPITRPLAALGVGFTVDWILWLIASGNGRYFIAMSCVAGILALALICHLVASPRIRAYLLALVLGVQCIQLCMGTVYRSHVPWDGRRWFEVRIPANLRQTPALYLTYGVQTNSFVVPYLPPGSGFVNIAGDYPLPADGANGAAVAALIHKYWPNVRVLALDSQPQDKRLPVVSGIAASADALLPFSLRPRTSDCSTIVALDAGSRDLMFVHTQLSGRSGRSRSIPDRAVRASGTGYLTTCSVAVYPGAHTELTPGRRQAEQALDRLEDACPELFQPARPVMQFYGNAHQTIWARRYLNTNLTAWVKSGWVEFIDPIKGGPATYIGREAAFEQKGAQIMCGRRNERYFAKLVPAAAPEGGS